MKACPFLQSVTAQLEFSGHMITLWRLIGGQVAKAYSHSGVDGLFRSCQVSSFRSDPSVWFVWMDWNSPC